MKEYTYEEFQQLANKETQDKFDLYFHKYSEGNQSDDDYYYCGVKYWSSLIK